MKKNKEKIKGEIRELISHKNSKDNKQAKKLAMRNNIKLKGLREEFCQKCFEPLNKKIRINKGYKIVRCKYCGKIHRFKLKSKTS